MPIVAQMPAPALPDLPEGPSLERLRGPVALPAWETWQILTLAALGLVLLAALAWAFLAYRRARRHKRATIPPDQAALAAVDAARLADDDERFAVLLSQALRRYLETKRGLAGSGQTTEEFLRTADLPPDTRRQLDEFLHTCDQVKFARRPLAEAERTQLADTARRLIESAETEDPPA